MDSETSGYGDMEFPFGKYKGYMVWEIADSEPSYIEWWLKNVTNAKEFNMKLKKYFKAKFPNGYE
jgi:uncharacterized protein (DUF3820 family)